MESSTTPSTPATSEKGPLDYLNDALEHLRKASEEAGGDVRSSIDEAIKEIRDAYEGTSKRAKDTAQEWIESLEGATEEVRRELAKLAVRAQGSTEALDDVEQEVARRRSEISKPPGDVAA